MLSMPPPGLSGGGCASCVAGVLLAGFPAVSHALRLNCYCLPSCWPSPLQSCQMPLPQQKHQQSAGAAAQRAPVLPPAQHMKMTNVSQTSFKRACNLKDLQSVAVSRVKLDAVCLHMIGRAASTCWGGEEAEGAGDPAAG